MEEQSNPNGVSPGDWVKDLFAPIYNFDDIVKAGRDGHTIKESIIKRVSILDPLSIKEVFERVHQRIVEAETKKLEEQREKQAEKKREQIDPRKSSIWNTEELDTLRQVYKASKGEIQKLELTLKECQIHNNTLEAKVAQQRNEIGTLQNQLAEAKKSNQRLVIHRDSLQKDLAVLEFKQAALTQMWHEIESEKTKSMNETREAHKRLDTERLNCQKLETKLMQCNQDLIRETALVESNLQTKYETEIRDLQEVVKDLTVELRDERQQHAATKRGLDHLRKHFSSIPLQDILPSGVVDEDEVPRIDHLSL